jgi:hypothetical protein
MANIIAKWRRRRRAAGPAEDLPIAWSKGSIRVSMKVFFTAPDPSGLDEA